jgi:uncharacterized protein with von Willebrand factor type A (vWA) domain
VSAVAGEGALPANIALFARALRRAGLRVGPGHVVDAVQAVEAAGLGGRDDLYWTLHAVLVSRREDHAVFDQAFRLFWRRRDYIDKLMSLLVPVATGAEKPPEQASRRVQDAMLPAAPVAPVEQRRVEVEGVFAVSDAELLRTKDFEQMTAAELAAAQRALRALRLPEEAVRTRRFAADPRGRAIDMRRSLRAALHGQAKLERRAPRFVVPPIVALCDVSGSMSRYTRVFLHFLHALAAQRRRTHVFLFGTRLTNVTRQLAHKDVDEALGLVARAVPDWEGGTRIATSLHAFNRLWSRRVLGQSATVLLLTDGLERDDAGLEREIERLHKSCRRLVWLNPLLRYDGFEPRAKGVRIMLPHVDEFRPVHDLNSVAELCAALGGGRREGDPRRWLARARPHPEPVEGGGRLRASTGSA